MVAPLFFAAGSAAGGGLTAMEGFGLVTGGVGLVSFAENHFPKPAKLPHTAFRVQVGLDSEALDEDDYHGAGGRLPDVRNFNAKREFLGMLVNGHKKVGQGTFKDFVVDQTNNQQPTYTLFTANKDPICIAYISTVWPDGQKYAWTGDFGRLCDKDW